MKINKTYKFKLKLTTTQKCRVDRWINSCRFVYNLAKETKEYAYKSAGISLNYYDLANQLPSLKEGEEWLKDIPSQTLQAVLERLDISFKNFFTNKSAYPKWANRYQYNSITLKGIQIESHNRLKVPKLKSVKYFNSRSVRGKIKSSTLIREVDGYYICLVTEQEIEPINKPIDENQAIGIDTGISYFAVTSDGEFIDNPRFLKSGLKTLRVEQRSLARKVKGSNSWNRQKVRLQKVHQKIKRQRVHFLHNLSSRLVRENDTIIVEDLKLANITKSSKGTVDCHGKNIKAKSGLNRSMLDLGLGIFYNQLEYKSKWSGGNLIRINPIYTSQTCFSCGHVCKENRLSQSKFKCMKCDYTQNADLNASNNIKQRGILDSHKGGLVKTVNRQREALVCA